MGVYPNQATQYDIFVTSILLRYRVGPLEKTKLTVKISQKMLFSSCLFFNGLLVHLYSELHILVHMSLRHNTVLDSDFGRRVDINLPRLGSISHLSSPLLLPAAYRASTSVDNQPKHTSQWHRWKTRRNQAPQKG